MSNDQKQATNSTYALVLLTTIFALGYMDRSIINLLLEPIKAEFSLSDTVLGLITGFGFALFQVSLGIPVARWADRGNRVNILTGGLLLWSFMTAISGRVSNAWQLAVARMGVGTGESALIAPSHSIMSDFFAKDKRPRAFSILSSGNDLGVIAGLLVGGWVAQQYGWRTAFFVAGVPGILMALLLKLTVKEPIRGLNDAGTKPAPTAFKETLSFICSQKAYLYALLGGSLLSLTLYCFNVWGPGFLRRVHHLSILEVGNYMAFVRVISISGTIAGGLLTERLCRGNDAWRLRIPALAALLTFPAAMLFLFADTVLLSFIGLGLATMMVGAHMGPVFALLQTVAKPRMRATAAATYMFTTNMVGSGLGTLLVGMLSDLFAKSYGMGNLSLRYALVFPASCALLSAVSFFVGSKFVKDNITNAAAN